MNAELTLGKNGTAEIVEQWVKCAAHDERTQRRKDSWHSFLRAATISRGGLEIQAMCRDISPRGIGLLHSERIRNGEATVSVWMQKRVLNMDVDITWEKSVGEGWWASGGRLNVSSFEHANLSISTMRAKFERRFHKRYPFFHSFSVYACSDRKDDSFDLDWQQEAFRALSLDVSRSGVTLMCEDPLEPQKQIVYLRRNASNDDVKLIRGRIVSRRELANGFFAIFTEFAPSKLRMRELF